MARLPPDVIALNQDSSAAMRAEAGEISIALKSWSKNNRSVLSVAVLAATKPQLADRSKPLPTVLSLDLKKDPLNAVKFIVEDADVVERDVLAEVVPQLGDAFRRFGRVMLILLKCGTVVDMVPIGLQDDLDKYPDTPGDWKRNLKVLMNSEGIEVAF
jgi:hypothetical protein